MDLSLRASWFLAEFFDDLVSVSTLRIDDELQDDDWVYR